MKAVIGKGTWQFRACQFWSANVCTTSAQIVCRKDGAFSSNICTEFGRLVVSVKPCHVACAMVPLACVQVEYVALCVTGRAGYL